MASYDSKAAWYDALYVGTGKDYAGEAAALLALVHREGIRPSSLLDVACGTGMHLAAFHETIPDVVGIDNAPAMLEIAKERLGDDVPLRHGDMRRFDLGRRFDVVTCLFSAVGHVRDEGDLDAAIERMAAHVEPGGLLLVEPWLTPDKVIGEGMKTLETARTEHGVVSRASRSVLRGDVLVLEFAWAVASDDGVSTDTETFRMPLFSKERYLASVAKAGLVPSWVELPELKAARGLLVGRRPGIAS